MPNDSGHIGLNIIAIRMIKKRGVVALLQKSIHLMLNYSPQESLEAQCSRLGVVQCLQSLKAEEMSLEKASLIQNGIGIRNLFEYQSLRISLYYLPKGQTMKLHNHPEMQVVSYVLQGELEAKVYTPLGNNFYEKITLKLQPSSLSFIDGLRNYNHNLHQFKALSPTFFVDIIFPDYDSDRDCQFFEEEGAVEGNRCTLKSVQHPIDFYQF